MRSLFLTLLILFTSCSTKNVVNISSIKDNSKKAKKAPYVLLISIDGYRWDYNDFYRPAFLSKFEKEGASVKSLRPSFPTKTFPNHLSIITGRYPMNHGIIANGFYNPEINAHYSLRDKESVANSGFYKALPFWGLAEKQGMKTATYFWPASSAKIMGQRPSYYLNYNHGTPHEDRIDQVYKWFQLPENKRPHFVTLYFHDVDSAGHSFGPKSKQVKNAINKVDRSIEKLLTNLEKLNLPINVIIVSDHGMTDLGKKNFESILNSKETMDFSKKFIIKGKGPIIHLYKNEDVNIKDALNAFNTNAKNYKCYTNKNTPKRLNFRNNPSIGDIVCLANKNWNIGAGFIGIPQGNHGWDQFEVKDMHAVFMAQGPSFKKAKKIGTVENVNVFPLMAKILNLDLNVEIDGNLSKMKALLK